MGPSRNRIHNATPMDLLHGWCAGVFKNVLATALAILLKTSGENYGVVFSEIEMRMRSMKRFPTCAGYAQSVFKNGSYKMFVWLFVTLRIGISDFVSTRQHRVALLGTSCSLTVGLGYHSKDFATILVHLGFALMTTVDHTRQGNNLVHGINARQLIVKTIFAALACYMELRRWM